MSLAEALLAAGLAVLASVVTAVVTTRLQAAAELRKWQREMRLSFAQLAGSDESAARRVQVSSRSAS